MSTKQFSEFKQKQRGRHVQKKGAAQTGRHIQHRTKFKNLSDKRSQHNTGRLHSRRPGSANVLYYTPPCFSLTVFPDSSISFDKTCQRGLRMIRVVCRVTLSPKWFFFPFPGPHFERGEIIGSTTAWSFW